MRVMRRITALFFGMQPLVLGTALPRDLPQLVLRNASVAPASVIQGGTFSHFATVDNSGVTVELSLVLSSDGTIGGVDDILLSTETAPRVESKASIVYGKEFKIPVNLKPGACSLFWLVDADERIPMEDRGKLMAQKSLVVRAPVMRLEIVEYQENQDLVALFEGLDSVKYFIEYSEDPIEWKQTEALEGSPSGQVVFKVERSSPLSKRFFRAASK